MAETRSSSADSWVARQSDGHVAILTLNRPEARNAVSYEVAIAMEKMLDEIEADPDIRAVVLQANTTGQHDPVFCAGADLKRVAAVSPVTEKGGFAGFVFRDRIKPFVAAVDGKAVAGGCELVLACDVVVATTRSSFAMPEVSRNLFAGAGAGFRLPAAVGRATALDMLLTTEPILAERAYQLGLISRLVEPGKAEEVALAVARKIAEQAPLAVQWTRRVVVASEQLDHDAELRLGHEANTALMRSRDTQEGLRAFAEKRKPDWSGS
jgi:enoyl-CoA hydratase